MPYHILIVDDRTLVRKELQTLLTLSGAVSVVSEAGDGWEALRVAQEQKPDIVLMDLEMPGMDGFEATCRIKALRPAQVVLAFSVYANVLTQQKALQAGADAFVVKGMDLPALLKTFENSLPREE